MGFLGKVARKVLRAGKSAVHAVGRGVQFAAPYVGRALQRKDSIMRGLGQLGIAGGTALASARSGNILGAAGGVMAGINAGKRLASDVKFIAQGNRSKRRKTGGQRVHGEKLGTHNEGQSNQPKMSADAVSRLSKL